MTKSEEEQQMEKARIGYHTAIGLVGLVSQEIYSRFNVMLTANSIHYCYNWLESSKRMDFAAS